MAPIGLEPDQRSMFNHLAWLAHPACGIAPDLRLEIAWGDPNVGPNRSRTYSLRELGAAVGFAAWINREKGCNVYVGATLKSPTAPERGRIGANLAALATCLPVDVDVQFIAAATKLATIAKPQLLVLTGRSPQPRGQLFVRIEPTSDLAAWQTVHERVIRQCGGDEHACGRGRLMRLAGTVSYPSSAKIERGYAVERTSAHLVPAPEFSVPELLALLPVPPTPSLSVEGYATSPGLGRKRKKPPLSAIEASLRVLPLAYAVERGLWIKVGFALHDFESSPLGLRLWAQFSQRCPQKAALTDFTSLWQGFSRPYAGQRITVRWLQFEALRVSFGG